MDRIHVVGALVVRDRRCLATRRGPAMSSPGCWELPGGKVEPGEDPRAALARELAEELGVEVTVGALVAGTVSDDPVPLSLDLYLTRLDEGAEPRPLEHDAYRWLAAPELDTVTWTPADQALLPAIRAFLEAR